MYNYMSASSRQSTLQRRPLYTNLEITAIIILVLLEFSLITYFLAGNKLDCRYWRSAWLVDRRIGAYMLRSPGTNNAPDTIFD